MSINNVGLFSRGRDVIFFGPRKNINPIWPHPPSKSPFRLLWEQSATSFMTMAYSVWYFYYWTYFLLFSLITFTTKLSLRHKIYYFLPSLSRLSIIELIWAPVTKRTDCLSTATKNEDVWILPIPNDWIVWLTRCLCITTWIWR